MDAIPAFAGTGFSEKSELENKQTRDRDLFLKK